MNEESPPLEIALLNDVVIVISISEESPSPGSAHDKNIFDFYFTLV
jgi:hypothetical protein